MKEITGKVERLMEMFEDSQDIGTGQCGIATTYFDKEYGALGPKHLLPKELCETLRPIIVEYYKKRLLEAERELRIKLEELLRGTENE